MQPARIPRPEIRLPDRLEDSDRFLDDPITIFEVEKVLPPRLYAALARTFPEAEAFGRRYERGGKLFLRKFIKPVRKMRRSLVVKQRIG